MKRTEAPGKIYWSVLVVPAILKLALHLAIHDHYGLHRDEYLYLNQSEHLSWGYMEVPPMIAVIAKTARFLMGETVFAARFFPALVGAVSILLVGIMARDLGGKKWAQLLAATTFLLSPAYLGSNHLFQPVSFNQFFWLLAAFFTVRIIRYQEPRYWHLLGITAGLGFLTKYSIVFFFIALICSFLLSPQRRVFRSRRPWISMGIALLIASPNLWWQYAHRFPVVRHMQELAATQLQHVAAADFLIPQFLFHAAGSLVWLGGLVVLLRSRHMRDVRLLAWTFLILMLILLLLSGKDYYTIGAYTMLLAAGGVAWEHWMGQRSAWLVPVIMLLNLPTIPYALPVLPIETMKTYAATLKNTLGLEAPLKWEDGLVRDLPQDYADMHGWEEIPLKVARLYHSLSDEEQARCMIIAGHYGQAGVLNYYRKQYGLPETYSLNSSFIMWVPEEVNFDRLIQVDDNRQSSSSFFHSVTLVDSIANPYARDPGLIYYKTQPKTDVKALWRQLVQDRKAAAGF